VDSNAATIALLEAARTLYGPAAPEKLLFSIFQKKPRPARPRSRGAPSPSAPRSWPGCAMPRAPWPSWSRDPATGVLRIVEYHCPILDLLKAFPIVARLEVEFSSPACSGRPCSGRR